MPTVRFTSGQELSAPTWDGLLERWRRLPWNRKFPEAEFRNVVAERAYQWCGQPVVHSSAPAAAIFRECERAKLLEIIKP